MSRSLRYIAVAVCFSAIGTAVFVGCKPSTSTPEAASDASAVATPKSESPATMDTAAEAHPHIPGAHGGIVIPIGSDSYHAEAVIEKDGVFRLLTLGADETRIQEVEVQAVKAYVKTTGESAAISIDMQATPQDGDAPGKTSQFVGQLPENAIGKAIDVTIPNLRIGTERFRVGFTTAVEVHDSGMPAAVTGDAEKLLYFTAAGKYTEADIKANGPLSAGTKFRGFMSKHDMNPKPGDLICPVTFTKANPKIEWQVNGEKYLFCCPPCVDEFVRMAKEEPDDVLEPGDYVQKEKKGREGDKEKGSNTDTSSTAPSSSTPGFQLDPEIAEALAALSREDRMQADAQKYCAVMTDSRLGSMGTPVKVEVNGQTVFLCCDGCKGKATRNAAETLANVAKLNADQAANLR